jgi:Uma2 family endonuclease
MSTIQARRAEPETLQADRVSLDMTGTVMTPDEFDSIEDWDEFYVYELIRGILVVSPSPSPLERGPVDYLAQILLNYQDRQPDRLALDATLSEHTIRVGSDRRRADRVIWAGLGRLLNFAEETPTIAIEFVSIGKRNRHRDYVEKRDEYLRCGVKEYWVVDRFQRCMTVFRDGEERRWVEPETYQTPLLPGFELVMAKLFGFIDRMAGQAGI